MSEGQFVGSMQTRQRIDGIEYIKWLNEYYDLINKRNILLARLNGRITGEIRADINADLDEIDGLLPVFIRKLNSHFFFDNAFNRQFVSINDSQHINERKNNVVNWTQFANGLIQIASGTATVILGKIGAAPTMGGTTFLVIAGSVSLVDGFNMIKHSLNDVSFSVTIPMTVSEIYKKLGATEEQTRVAEVSASFATSFITLTMPVTVGMSTAIAISNALSGIGLYTSAADILILLRNMQ